MNSRHPIYQEALEYVKAYPGSSHQLSKELGLSQSWVSKFRNGEIENPGIMTLQRILDHKSKQQHAAA